MDIVRNYHLATLALECTDLIPDVTQIIKGIMVALSTDYDTLHYCADKYVAYDDIAEIEKYLWLSDSDELRIIMRRCGILRTKRGVLNHVSALIVYELSMPCRALVLTGNTRRYDQAAAAMDVNTHSDMFTLIRYLRHSQDPEIRYKVDWAINYVRNM